jgi:hypothetical protein
VGQIVQLPSHKAFLILPKLEKENCSNYPNDRILIIRVKVWIGDPNNAGCDGNVVVDAMAIERF